MPESDNWGEDETKVEHIGLTDGEKHRLESYWKQLRFSNRQMTDVRKLIETSNSGLINDIKQMIQNGLDTMASEAKDEAKRIYDKIDKHESDNHTQRMDDLVRITKVETTMKNAFWAMPILFVSLFSMAQLLSSWYFKS